MQNVVRSQRLRGCLRPVAVAAPPPCSAAAEGSWPRRAGRSSSPAGNAADKKKKTLRKLKIWETLKGLPASSIRWWARRSRFEGSPLLLFDISSFPSIRVRNWKYISWQLLNYWSMHGDCTGTCFTYHRRRWLEVVDGEAAGVGVGHADHRRALHGGGRRRHERRHPRQGRHVWWAHPDGAHPLHVLVHAGRREHHRRRRHSAAHPHHLNHAIHIIIVGLSLINFSIELHSFYVVQTCSWSCSDLRYSIASSSIDALSVWKYETRMRSPFSNKFDLNFNEMYSNVASCNYVMALAD